jgi:hypothetical protein
MQGHKNHEQLGRKRYALPKRRESHVTQRHIPEERNHRLHRSEHLKTRNDGNLATIGALLSNLLAVTTVMWHWEPV